MRRGVLFRTVPLHIFIAIWNIQIQRACSGLRFKTCPKRIRRLSTSRLWKVASCVTKGDGGLDGFPLSLRLALITNVSKEDTGGPQGERRHEDGDDGEQCQG
jgi:hypothetical protein